MTITANDNLRNKEVLVERFFEIIAAQGLEDLSVLKDEIKSHLDLDEQKDRQLADILVLLALYERDMADSDEDENNESEASLIEMALESFNALEELDLVDIRTFSMVVSFVEDINIQIEMINKIIKSTNKKYHRHAQYDSVRATLYINITAKLLKIRYAEDGSEKNIEGSIERLFAKYVNRYSEIYTKHKGELGFEKGYAVILIRKGLFIRSIPVVDEGLELLKKVGTEDEIKGIRLEIEDCRNKMDFSFSKEKIDLIIGSNIKKMRMERDLSVARLADMLKMTTASVRFMEKGERGLTITTVFKLCKIFNIEMEQLFVGVDEIEVFSTSKVEGYNRLASYGLKLQSEEIDFLISTAEELIRYRQKIIAGKVKNY